MAPKYNNKLLQEEMLIALEQIPLALAAVGLPKVIPKIGMDDTGTLPKYLEPVSTTRRAASTRKVDKFFEQLLPALQTRRMAAARRIIGPEAASNLSEYAPRYFCTKILTPLRKVLDVEDESVFTRLAMRRYAGAAARAAGVAAGTLPDGTAIFSSDGGDAVEVEPSATPHAAPSHAAATSSAGLMPHATRSRDATSASAADATAPSDPAHLGAGMSPAWVSMLVSGHVVAECGRCNVCTICIT